MERKDLINLGFEDTYPFDSISMSTTCKKGLASASLYVRGPKVNPLKKIELGLDITKLENIIDPRELDEIYEEAIKVLYKIKEAHIQLLNKNHS